VKKIALSLVWLFAMGGLAAAQTGFGPFEGRATWEILEVGMWAAHNSLPEGSTVTVRNIATGMVAEVVIIERRIPVSHERVIDLSVDAARAIGLELGRQDVRVYPPVVAQPLAYGTAAWEGGQIRVYTTPPEPSALAGGINVTIYNHLVPRSAWMALRHNVPSELVVPPLRIRYTPYMPNPNSGRLYRLQVGIWADVYAALDALHRLLESNFNHLSIDRMYSRVYINHVPASEVYRFVRRLDAMDFTDVDIRVQN